MTRGKRTRVLVVDDHAIVRQGLRAILDAEPDIEVVGEAADGREAVRKALTLLPDVVVMDVSMPRMNGLEATARIVKESPGIRVVALTMHSSEEYVYSLLKAGARVSWTPTGGIVARSREDLEPRLREWSRTLGIDVKGLSILPATQRYLRAPRVALYQPWLPNMDEG